MTTTDQLSAEVADHLALEAGRIIFAQEVDWTRVEREAEWFQAEEAYAGHLPALFEGYERALQDALNELGEHLRMAP